MLNPAPDQNGICTLWPTFLLNRLIQSATQPNQLLEKIILEQDQKHQQMTTDYQTRNFLDEPHQAVVWLKQCINKSVIDYMSHVGIGYPVEWFVHGWPNVNRYGDYHNLHNHPHSYLSGTYYVAVPESVELENNRSDINPGEISFFDPRPQANMNAIHMDRQSEPEYRVLPEPGQILLWPSFLHHMVHPNLSARPRISISFNIMLKRSDHQIPGANAGG